MVSFDEHINQAKRNLNFLKSVNDLTNNTWDWQVTIAFYSAVHLINAHLAKKADLHYRSHKRVDDAINPYNNLSFTRLKESEFLAYKKLQSLSRRSRYLCNDKSDDKSASLTYDKHFSKAIKNLDTIIQWISTEYEVSFEEYDIACIELHNYTSNIFKIV